VVACSGTKVKQKSEIQTLSVMILHSRRDDLIRFYMT